MRNTTVYQLAGPRTFRRGSRKVLGKWGGNLQNVSKSLREIYIPDGIDEDNPKQVEKLLFWLKTGDYSVFTQEELETIRVFCQVDQSGAEALIVAYECYAGDYRKLFENNVKPHVYLGLKLFKPLWADYARKCNIVGVDEDVIETLYNTKIEDLNKHPHWRDVKNLIADSDNWSLSERYYYFAKQTCHSANYDIQWARFLLNLLEKSGGKIVLLKEQGQFFLNTYRALFPEIPDRCYRIGEQAKKTRMLFNLHGFPYTITDYDIPDTRLKELYAWSAQSTVGEITRIAFSRLQEQIEDEKLPYDLLADTHDSYLVQCPLYSVPDATMRMSREMNQPLISPYDGVKFNMKSECQVGLNWSPKKDKNPLGLRELNWK